jgi:hypothetical protein
LVPTVAGSGDVNVLTNQTLDNDRFEFIADSLVRGSKVYFQLIVEEVDRLSGGVQKPTGRWAGSRGTWVGLGKS